MKDRADIETMLNHLYRQAEADRFFDEPSVRVASASDPFFIKFKEIIGPFHWTPDEVLKRKFPNAEAKSVIVWILPVSSSAQGDNGTETPRPSAEWAFVRSLGEMRNETMHALLEKQLTQAGIPSVAPCLEQKNIYPGQGWDVEHFTSNWSERHVAFVAGAGTFGLSASLITEHGTAVRLGSVVTTLELAADDRPYGDDPFAWCLRCGACIRRCPAHAVGEHFSDRDKPACADYALQKIDRDHEHRYGWRERGLGCALCQTAVPCEFQRPQEKNASIPQKNAKNRKEAPSY